MVAAALAALLISPAFARALEQGARLTLGLRNKVSYGQLNVACSLRWLLARRVPNWRMFSLAQLEQIDPAGYKNLVDATTPCGSGGQDPYVEQEPVEGATGTVFAKGARLPTVGKFVESLKLGDAETSNSLRWQDVLTQSPDGAGRRVVFPVFAARGAVSPPDRPVYPLGEVSVGCTKQGYRITNVTVGFRNLFPPADGWWLPINDFSPFKKIRIAVAVARPWYLALLGSKVEARATVRCQFFAAEGK